MRLAGLSKLMRMAVLATLVGASAPTSADLWVAPGGDDLAAGTRRAPFATLGRAVAAARAAGPASTHIRLRPGTYVLTEPLELGPLDSGLTIEGGPRVVIDGGRRVRGWSRWKGRIFAADPGALDLPDLGFRVLYRNAKLMPWARVPNFDPRRPRTGGVLQNERVASEGTTTTFVYREGALDPESWSHPERAWINFHDSLNYETQFAPVTRIDAARREIEAQSGVYALSRGSPFFVCGLLEELDAPGEWCVDPETSTLYFWPPAGGPGEVIVPAVESAFVLKGDAAAGRFVENVRIEGLAVRDFRGRAIEMTAAKSCTVAACDLRNAEVGVHIGDDTHGCAVVGCDITQTQGDGVSIVAGAVDGSADHERISDHVVDNCHVWDIGWGRIHNRCAGVFLRSCARVKVTHNHIHDTPRYAIGMDVGRDCELAWNDCHDSNLVTADTGIIEAATSVDWALPIDEQTERNRTVNVGNTIHHNLLHGSGGWGTATGWELRSPYYSWGIYLDLACSGWRVHDNVCFDTAMGGFFNNGGSENVVENNVFVDGQAAQFWTGPWPGYPIAGNRCERNVFAWRPGGAVAYELVSLDGRVIDDSVIHFERNLLWADGETPVVRGLSGVKLKDSWSSWLARGQDQGTLVADPMFVGRARDDYRLRTGSPAEGLGILPIDLSGVGNYASRDRRTPPGRRVRIARETLDYAPTGGSNRQPRLRTYEDATVGVPDFGATIGNSGVWAALVTDATGAPDAAGTPSTQCLAFTDAAGPTPSFLPYVVYPLQLREGALRMSFDLRWETGALAAVEWRDHPLVYDLGPSLSTTADGRLLANGRDLLQLPAGRWVRVAIDCGLGSQATGTYDLTVTLPDAAPQVFRDVACSPAFSTIDVAVWMSLADAATTFYVDNLAFEPRAAK